MGCWQRDTCKLTCFTEGKALGKTWSSRDAAGSPQDPIHSVSASLALCSSSTCWPQKAQHCCAGTSALRRHLLQLPRLSGANG